MAKLRPIAKPKGSGGGGFFIRLLGCIFLIAGAAILYFLTFRPAYLWLEAKQWPEVECVITSSQVGEHSDSDGTTYSIDIVYSYQFDGASYTSNRYGFMDGSSSGYNRKARVVEQYPAGSLRICFVDPRAPDYSVLNREFSLFYLVGLFGLIFFLFGFGMLFSRGKTSSASKPDQALIILNRNHGEALRFDSAATRRHALMKSGVGTALFSGFVLVFSGIFYVSTEEEGFSENIVFFLVIGLFWLISIFLIVKFIADVLRLWNATYAVEITPMPLRLGQTHELSWTMQGKVERVKRMRLWLEGREWVQYRQGTDTRTDTNVFEKILILEATSAQDMKAGRVQFTVPEFTMPTFLAENNRIDWMLKTEGVIEGWPDITDEYEVVIAALLLSQEAAI